MFRAMKSIILILFIGFMSFAYSEQKDDCLDCVRDVVDALDYCKVTLIPMFYVKPISTNTFTG